MVSIDSRNKMNPDHAALLVIDVQQALFERSTPIYKAEELISNINRLITTCKESGSLVVFIQHANKSLLKKGTPEWEIHSGLIRAEDDPVIHKEHGNAFQKTQLHELLQSQGIDTFVAAGLVSHGCVRATCLGGLELGYHVFLAADGHSSWRKDAAEVIVSVNQEMKEAGVEIAAVEEIAAS